MHFRVKRESKKIRDRKPGTDGDRKKAGKWEGEMEVKAETGMWENEWGMTAITCMTERDDISIPNRHLYESDLCPGQISII